MRALAVILLARASFGCSRGQPAPPRAPPPPAHADAAAAAQSAPAASVTASASASVAASASPPSAPSAPSAPPAILALPIAPPGADPEVVRLAASICAASYRVDPTTKNKLVGCRSHPPFVLPEQQPDGKLPEHTGDPLLFCGIDHVFRGSFTRAGAKQAIVSFEQCKESESAPWDSGFPGSAVLVESVDGRWKAVGYEPDVTLNLCLQDHRADGRDVLLCRSNLGAPPAGDVRFVFVLDFARGLAGAGQRSAATLARLFGDVPGCTLVDESLSRGYVSLAITGMSLADVNKDGTGDLVVKVKRARVPPSAGLAARVRALCMNDPGGGGASAFLPPPKETSLVFLSAGPSFAPSAATKKELDAWTAEAPEGFNGLSGVGPPPLAP